MHVPILCLHSILMLPLQHFALVFSGNAYLQHVMGHSFQVTPLF